MVDNSRKSYLRRHGLREKSSFMVKKSTVRLSVKEKEPFKNSPRMRNKIIVVMTI